jgi:hypothetical protein
MLKANTVAPIKNFLMATPVANCCRHPVVPLGFPRRTGASKGKRGAGQRANDGVWRHKAFDTRVLQLMKKFDLLGRNYLEWR